MAVDPKIEAVKGRLEEYLNYRRIDTSKNFKCITGTHTDNNPSMGIDREHKRAHCFACDAKLDIFDVIGLLDGVPDRGEQIKRALSWAEYEYKGQGATGLQKGAYKPQETQKGMNTQNGGKINSGPVCEPIEERPEIRAKIETWKAHIGDTDYFTERGLSPEIIKNFNLGYDPDFIEEGISNKTGEPYTEKQGPAAIIPIGKDYYMARIIGREGAKKYIKPQGPPHGPLMPLMNEEYLREPDKWPCFIVEGPFDALSIEQAGGPAIALNGIGHTRLISLIKETHKKQPDKVYILCLDNDATGQGTTGKIKAALDEIGAWHTEINISGDYKDPNEALNKAPEAFRLAVARAQEEAYGIKEAQKAAEKEEYEKETRASLYINAFKEAVEAAANTPAISTGFKGLDAQLDGGFYEGLYVIGAITGLGKTALALHIADNIALNGGDVLIFTLEMGRMELIARSLSRLTLEGAGDRPDLAKTTRGISAGNKYKLYSDEEKALIARAVASYRGYADNLYISEGLGDIGVKQIREGVDRHIRLTGRKPFVIVDYLQILSPYDMRATDKQNTDKAIMELKRISRDYRLPVLAVSSLNRASYNGPVSLEAFKESGAIEYSSDVLIGMQYKGIKRVKKDKDSEGEDLDTFTENAQKKEPRDIQLRILKNRNGKAGELIPMKYRAKFNYFFED